MTGNRPDGECRAYWFEDHKAPFEEEIALDGVSKWCSKCGEYYQFNYNFQKDGGVLEYEREKIS